MLRVDFQDAAGLEHGVVGSGKGLFHSQGRAGSVGDEADGTALQAVGQADIGDFIA